jgi:type II secretory pathway component GspD/PulD (secretin)
MPSFSVQVGQVAITTIGTGGSSITSPQPVVDKREADTIALVRNGQTVVIGGLRKQTVNRDITKVPMLGDMPMLGWLFRFEGEETVTNELVVFITPKIIEESVLTETEAIYLEATNITSPLPLPPRIDSATGKLKALEQTSK